MCLFLYFLIFFLIFSSGNGFEHFLSSAYGEVGKGNFTYHSMSHDGTVLVELESISGDCDLYVSQITNKPTYEPESYCLQSATCGLDSVIVPKSFNRPVGIGVFGHPSHDVCLYKLALYRIADHRDIFNYDGGDRSLNPHLSKKSQENFNLNTTEEEESFFWVFLRSSVMILIEFIL